MLLIDNEAEFKAEFNLHSHSHVHERVRTLSHADTHTAQKWLQRFHDDAPELPIYQFLKVFFWRIHSEEF